MKINTKAIRSIVCAALLLALIPGCASNKNTSPLPQTDADGNVITTIGNTSSVSETTGGTTPTTPEEIKALYTPSEEDLAVLAEENTVSPIVYTGFKGDFFSTPVKSDETPKMVIMPIFSQAGLQQYIDENSAYYDFGSGDGSFADITEKYPDTFFMGKGLLVISLIDSDGGKNHVLTGAYENHFHIDEVHLDELVLTVKKAEGDITSGHVIVEMDTSFINLWDGFSVSLYE